MNHFSYFIEGRDYERYILQNIWILEWPSKLRIQELQSVNTISAHSKIFLSYKYIEIL